MYAKILKYNPYHDQRGRFTSKGGIGMAGVHSMSWGGNATLVNARDREAYLEHAKQNAPVFAHLEEQAFDPILGDWDAHRQRAEALEKVEEGWTKDTQATWSNLTPQEQGAVRAYTAGSAAINGYLSGRYKDDLTKSDIAVAEMNIKGTDSALAKSTAHQDMILYRGLSVKSLGIDKDTWSSLGNAEAKDYSKQHKLLSGMREMGLSTYTEKGYGSTSVFRSNAENFLTQGRVMAKIEIQKGQKALYLGSDRNRTQYPHEKEVLLPRGAKYQIKGVEEGPDGYPILRVAYLGD